MAPGVQPQCQGATPVKRSPGRQPKLLFPYRWAHKLALPYPTSAQESVSHLLSGHTHAPKDLLSLLVTHTHTHTHVIPHPLTSPFPAPSSSTDITGLRRKKYSFSSLKESLYFLQIRDRESLYHYHSLCITDPLLPTVSSSSDRKHTPCVSTDKIFTKTQSFSYKKPDKHLKQWHKPLFQG